MKKTPLLSLILGVTCASGASAGQASFDCSKSEQGSIAELVCQTPELAELDQKLASVYQAATGKAQNQQPPLLKTEQRGWLKSRDECWKSDDKTLCVADSYRTRIAELQARYALVEGRGPVRFICDGNPSKELTAIFYPTIPATALFELGDQTSLMYQQVAASGSRYQGRNESFWEHQGEARVTWGYDTPEMICKPL